MGIILMLLASASFATMSAMLKGIGPTVPLTQLVFLRCIMAVPFLFAWVICQERPVVVRAKRLLLVRTILGMTAMYGYFYALTHMPLADCIFIGRTNPLLLALFAPLVLGETTPPAAWIAISTGVIGVALIMKPAMAWPVAAWVALGASAIAAAAQLTVRRLNRTDHPLVIVFNFTLLTGLLTACKALPEFVSMNRQQWLLIIGVAVFASLGQLLMTAAYGRDRAPAVAAASYSSVVLSVVYGYLFWKEVPQPLAWWGGGLIIVGGLLLLKSRYKISEPAG
jgi:drug/metabolite transporter (DMT)-like permease